MKFCDDHWTALRDAIEKRGLTHLVSEDGATAAARMASELRNGPQPSNFDPLMDAYWAIMNNVTRMIGEENPGGVMYLMMGDAALEDPVVERPGRTWSRCPLCYINLAHEISCSDPRCALDKLRGFDWMIERAADDANDRATNP